MRDKSEPIFCVFCAERFTTSQKDKAAKHYWTHFSPSLKSSGPDVVIGSHPLKSEGNSDELNHIVRWITDFVNFCAEQKAIKENNNWKHCPVCERMCPKTVKIQRKRSVLKEHIRSHLSYRQYGCLICSESPELKSQNKKLVLCVNDKMGHQTLFHLSTNPHHNFHTRKTSRKTLTKHIREDHMGEVVKSPLVSLTKAQLVTMDELITARRINALDILVDFAQATGGVETGPSQEVFISDKNEVLTITTQPLQGAKVRADENSLLMPRFNFSTKDFLPKRKRKKPSSDDEVFVLKELDLREDIDLLQEVDSLISSSSFSIEDVDNEIDLTTSAAFYRSKASIDHPYCRLPTTGDPKQSPPSACGSNSDLISDNRDSGYASDVSDDGLSELLDSALELYEEHKGRPLNLDHLLSGFNNDALTKLEKQLEGQELVELTHESVDEMMYSLLVDCAKFSNTI